MLVIKKIFIISFFLILISCQTKKTYILVDCGSGVTQRLEQAKISSATIDALLLTHLHSDHVVDLYQLIISSWHSYRYKSWKIYGPKGTKKFASKIMEAWKDERQLRIQYEERSNIAAFNLQITEFKEYGKIKIKDTMILSIESERRANIRACHSATHLLHEALRRTLGQHVIQKGSFVGPDRLRFDFSHTKPIQEDEVKKIEEYVNRMVKSNSEVRTRLMTPKEAVENGALALFGEKYGEEVRVLSMGNEKDKYFSTELCGGTHVKNTSEIGDFKIVGQSAIAAGVRRVEALRSTQLANYLKEKQQASDDLHKVASDKIRSLQEAIKTFGKEPVSVNEFSSNEKIKKLNKQLEQIKIKLILEDKTKNQIKDKSIKGINVRFQVVKDFPSKELRSLIDQGKKDLKEGIIIAYTIMDKKIGIAVGVTSSLTKKYNAVELVKVGSSVIGGVGGGGRNDFAQAGGKESTKIVESFNNIIKSIK